VKQSLCTAEQSGDTTEDETSCAGCGFHKNLFAFLQIYVKTLEVAQNR